MSSLSISKLFGIDGMVAVVTGGGSGIGRMMTHGLAANGAKVYIVGRRKDKLEETATFAPDRIIPVVGDVTSKASLQVIAEQVKSEVGFLNLLICNSGVMTSSIPVKSNDVDVATFAKAAMDTSPDDWNQTFAVNVTAVMYCTYAFLELLDAGNKKGNMPSVKSQVLVTTSIAGYLRIAGANMSYGASKAAATHMIKHLSGNLIPYSIRVNGIAPGLFPSDLAAGLISAGGAAKDPTVEGAFEKSFIPLQRTGKAEDMAGTVLYMVSAAGAYLDGCVVVLDGGRIAQLPGTY